MSADPANDPTAPAGAASPASKTAPSFESTPTVAAASALATAPSPELAPALDVRCIVRRYGNLTAVASLSFIVARGQVCGFIGPNGAGKTTTMRILATLDLPDAGDALIAGCSVLGDPREVRRCVGFMSDRFFPYKGVDVEQYLDFYARAQGLRGERRREMLRSVIDFCGLSTFLERPATGLSKGMGQRLHLARTLLHDPSVLILDEPTAGLDPHARIEFRALVRELAAQGKSVLVSSHILSELQEVCDTVVVIESGRRVLEGRIDDIGRQAGARRRMELRVLRDDGALQRFLLVQPHVADLAVDGLRADFGFDGDDEAVAALLAAAVGAGLPVTGLRQRDAGLEDIFLRATRGALQ
jgi:ABC-2 type transport system ATP-binding protein